MVADTITVQFYGDGFTNVHICQNVPNSLFKYVQFIGSQLYLDKLLKTSICKKTENYKKVIRLIHHTDSWKKRIKLNNGTQIYICQSPIS